MGVFLSRHRPHNRVRAPHSLTYDTNNSSQGSKTPVKWAMAGRDARKLEQIKDELAKLDADVKVRVCVVVCGSRRAAAAAAGDTMAERGRGCI